MDFRLDGSKAPIHQSNAEIDALLSFPDELTGQFQVEEANEQPDPADIMLARIEELSRKIAEDDAGRKTGAGLALPRTARSREGLTFTLPAVAPSEPLAALKEAVERARQSSMAAEPRWVGQWTDLTRFSRRFLRKHLSRSARTRASIVAIFVAVTMLSVALSRLTGEGERLRVNEFGSASGMAVLASTPVSGFPIGAAPAVVTPDRITLSNALTRRAVQPVSDPVPPRAAARTSAFTGTLTVNSAPYGATVFVNRREVGTTPMTLRRFPIGDHAVWVEQQGYQRWTGTVRVAAEQVTTISPKLIKPVARRQLDAPLSAQTKLPIQ